MIRFQLFLQLFSCSRVYLDLISRIDVPIGVEIRKTNWYGLMGDLFENISINNRILQLDI